MDYALKLRLPSRNRWFLYSLNAFSHRHRDAETNAENKRWSDSLTAQF
jgi:hypothetical protein